MLHDLYDPSNPNYRQFLTPAEFTERFGPTEQDYQALIAFAEANGLTVTGTHRNRALLEVTGSVQDIERLFHVTLRSYQHPREARTFFAPDVEPTVDAPVTLLHVGGLENFELPRPNHRIEPVRAPATVIPNAGSGPGGTYRGNDFRSAYVPGTTLTGQGQNVALVEFDGYYANDITSYISQSGISSSTVLTNVAVNGGVSVVGSNNTEVALDIELAVAMAPGLSKIYVYEAPNGTAWSTILSRIANDNQAQQISCSWAGGSPSPSAEQALIQMATQGQTYFNSSGDQDSYVGATNFPGFPTDSTNFTVVGGTVLTTSGSTYQSETVWNDRTVNPNGGNWGSSGGISPNYAIPTYQQGVSMSGNQGSTTARNLPDVALTAKNIWVVFNNGSSGAVGGTSCAAPLWAGFMALVNQQAAASGDPAIGFFNPTLYNLGRSASYTTYFHDITSGDNTWSTFPSQFFATTGYDLCTGWGTPNGTNLINVLAPIRPNCIVTSGVLLTESCSPANGVLDPGETVTMNFTIQNTGGAGVANLVATLLATNGVTAPGGSQTYGVLAANGGLATKSFSFTANGACGGTVTATFQLQDGANNLGLATYTIPLGAIQQDLAQNFDGVTAPNLPGGWTTTAGGGESLWTTSTAASDTAPNAAFSPDASNAGSNALISTVIPISSANAVLTFRQNYNLRLSASFGAYSAGVLEVSVGGGAFQDILAAGGSFTAGGYNSTVSTRRGNPLTGGRACWSGNSGGFITTTVALPASMAGQNIQLRWVCATSTSSANVGWYVDSIQVTEGNCCTGALPPPVASFTANPVSGVAPLPVTFTDNSTGSITNRFWNFGDGATSNTTSTTVSHTYAAFGNFTASLTVSGSGGSSGASTNIAVAKPAQLSVSPAGYDFGTVATGASPQTTFVVSNLGSATLTGTAATTSPFSIGSGASFTVPGGGTSNIVVSFSPGAAGSFTNNVIFASNGGASSNQVTGVGAVAPSASFTANSTLGVTPFNVAFTDVSNGTITNRYWDFGDGTTTNVTVAGVSHTYVTTGVFPVALTVSGPVGQNTQTQNQLITVLDPNADADGDGFTNAQELQAGTNTFDPNSYSHITNVQIVGGDVQITFPSVSGKLYDLEANSDLTTTNWNVLQTNIPGTGSPVTVTDTGGANATNRCYRVGVLP